MQFRGPITTADRETLEQTGIQILEYLPDYAYLVEGTSTQLAAAEQLPQIYTRIPFTVADKLDPSILNALERGETNLGHIRVSGWDGQNTIAQEALNTATIDTAMPLNDDTLLQIVQIPSIRWIEPAIQPRLFNDVACDIMNVDSSAWQDTGLYGSGQIVGFSDSGLDTGNMETMSPDFKDRIVATHVLSDGGDLADDFGHGTHVAGSIASSGVQSGANPEERDFAGSFAGSAPEAELVVQAFEATPEGQVVGLDEDHYKLFAQAYEDGARLHTNSWGAPTADEDAENPDPDTEYGGYTYSAQRTDEFMWNHQDMAIFFGAGNSGKDGESIASIFCANGDGVVDPDSLLSPGTAKNVITVGATETQRESGGFGGWPWALINPCFVLEPIAFDSSTNNPDGMAAFSSRGPTDDGRIKPDIVAPGTNIVSNRTQQEGANPVFLVYESNEYYAYSSGTSMATPLVAGTGALARQWLTTQGHENPSAAAVKALLLNTTYDIAPGQYGTGEQQEIPSEWPNSVAGWGRTDMSFMSAPPPYRLWVDDRTEGVETEQTVAYEHSAEQPLEVISSDQPLRVMLVWTDPPASLSAAKQLVNDLDLVVTGPDGTEYYGNGGSDDDRTNNVEGVIIDNPPVGQYSVTVQGHNVPIESQPYTLVVAGPLDDAGRLNVAKTASPSTDVLPGAEIRYTLTAQSNVTTTETVVLTDMLPLNTTFVSASEGGQLEGSVVTWTIDSLVPGEPVDRELVVRVDDDISPETTIVNQSYGIANGVELPGSGTPISVPVQEPDDVDPQTGRIWLPYLAQ
ncbi:MAG: S8 family serine peptidase [Chloroflexota bacterium]